MKLKVLVCIKQVPDTNNVKIDKETGTLIRKGIKSILNPEDKNALEEALRLKDEIGDVFITVLSMGPNQASVVVKEAIAMGADRGILLSDRNFAGSDTWATSAILSSAINKIKEEDGLDLIFCGRQAIDGDTAQVGPQIAQHLKLPVISYVEELKYSENKVLVKRAVEDGHYIVECPTPVLLTAVKQLNTPRYPNMKRIFETFGENPERPIETWTAEDISLAKENMGLNGSPTRVKKIFTPSRKFEGEFLQGNPKEVARQLIVRLKERQII